VVFFLLGFGFVFISLFGGGWQLGLAGRGGFGFWRSQNTHPSGQSFALSNQRVLSLPLRVNKKPG